MAQVDPHLEVRVLRNDERSPADIAALGPSHLLISPGPCGPAEAGCSVDLIRALAGRVPMLGVCLGMQCMAVVAGGRVVRAPAPVHGRTCAITHDARGVFAGLPQPLRVMRYHSLAIDPASLNPDEWTVSARDAFGVPMGLRRRWGSGDAPHRTPPAPLEGVQFHPESFLTEHGEQMLANFLRS